MPIKSFECEECGFINDIFIYENKSNNSKCSNCGSERLKETLKGYKFLSPPNTKYLDRIDNIQIDSDNLAEEKIQNFQTNILSKI